MSRSKLHDWECAIEKLSGDNADKMLAIAQDIYNTAFVRGKNYISLEQEPCDDKRLYIKVFADLEPDDIAEKIYQICDEDKFPKVIESLKEYFDSKPCEDAISRQVALDGLASIAKAKAKSDAQKSLMGRVMFFTEHLPSVTPQQKMGKWIAVENEEMETIGYYCSECDLPMETEQRTFFCPNCGAKMEESKEP